LLIPFIVLLLPQSPFFPHQGFPKKGTILPLEEDGTKGTPIP
jgi:hypothetical protein